jgi:A1 cistron-splicing factor AAR2
VKDDSIHEEVSIQEAWTKVFGSKNVLLVESFPSGLEFGCNCMVYETGPKFRGIAMIPSGLNFIYYSHINFPRLGFFTRLVSSSEPLKYRTWNNETDELLLTTNPGILEQKVHEIIRGDHNSGLAQYAEEQHATWQNISQFITDSVLQLANCTLESTLHAGDDADETEGDRHLTKILTSNQKRPSNVLSTSPGARSSTQTASYCPIQSIEADIVHATYNQAGFAARLTAMELDKSWLLEAMLERYYHQQTNQSLQEMSFPWSAVLGELQISFIMFMLLYSYHSLNHWKRLIAYIAKAEKYLQQHQDFAAAFVKVLFHQLKFIPDDFFENEISANSFILPSLTSLFSCLNFSGMNEDLEEHKKRFERYLTRRFNIRVVSTSIQQYQSSSTNESGQTGEQEVALVEENAVSDAYCTLEGHDNEENAAEFAGQYAFAQSSAERLEFNTPVQYSIPAGQILSPAEKEAHRFSWRYPLVFETMQAAQGREDMLMTALRIYDEVEQQQVLDPSTVTSEMQGRYLEAIKFIENEGPLC